jgi:hypothetical protein
VDPYRSAPSAPQFVCVVCYRSLSVHPGECPTCGVDRLPLSDPEVRAEVRAEAERRLQNKLYGEWMGAYLLAGMFAALFVVFPLTGGLLGGGIWIITTMLFGSINLKIWERLSKRSALHLYAERRRRFALAAAERQKALPARRSDDPEDADLAKVLELLGCKVTRA